MQRYQPPHMRQRSQHSSTSTPRISGETKAGGSSGSANSSTPNHTNSYTPRPSRRDWSTSSRPTHDALASPAADLQPMRRTPMKHVDEMELIQSVSRSGGDGAEGDALKDWTLQEKYRSYIDERLDKHYSTFARDRHVAPPFDAEDELHSLGSIVLLLRKLREGVVASNRIDSFAIEVFESSARLSILARNTGQLLSSLSGLVPGLYQAVDRLKGKAKAVRPIERITDQLEELHVTDNRAKFTSLLLVFHLVQSGRRVSHETLVELTSPIVLRLNQPFSDPSTPVSHSHEAFISLNHLAFAQEAARALSKERFDPMSYYRLVGDSGGGSPYERALLRWAEKEVQDRAWAVLSKAYLQCSLEWAGTWLGEDEEAQIRSTLAARGGKVEGILVKMR